MAQALCHTVYRVVYGAQASEVFLQKLGKGHFERHVEPPLIPSSIGRVQEDTGKREITPKDRKHYEIGNRNGSDNPESCLVREKKRGAQEHV